MTTRPRDKRKKHVATGRPKGGRREGAGRPPGTKNLFPMGAIKAIKALNMRVPDNVTDGQRDILAETEEAVLKVMRGRVHGSIATPVLKAAVTVREEICGPLTKKVEVQGSLGLTGLLDEVAKAEKEEQAAKEPGPVEPKGPIIRKKV